MSDDFGFSEEEEESNESEEEEEELNEHGMIRLHIENGLHFLKNKTTDSDDPEKIKEKMIDILTKIKRILDEIHDIFD